MQTASSAVEDRKLSFFSKRIKNGLILYISKRTSSGGRGFVDRRRGNISFKKAEEASGSGLCFPSISKLAKSKVITSVA